MKVKILNIESITHDVNRYVLEKPKGYRFVPGQATYISINKPGWKDEKRPFTFTSLNSEGDLEFVIKSYDPKKYPKHRGMTWELTKSKVGDELMVRKPWGAINYQGPGVFIAGGAGITPFLAIFRQLFKQKELDGNRLLFSNKTAKDVILESELRNMFNGSELVLTLTREKGAGYRNGRINRKFLEKHAGDFVGQNFYVCGPKQMVMDINKTLSSYGVPSDYLVFEK